MADPYIDSFETQIYGKHACEQMTKICLGRIPELDAMITFAANTQAGANTAMKLVLDKQPKTLPAEDPATVLEDARDTIVRFGSYLGSLKGRPVSPAAFFRNATPSDVARRRIVKLAAAVEHIAAEIPKHAGITDPAWHADFTSLSARLQGVKSDQHDAKVQKIDLAPEVAAERDRWLATYAANKLLVRGFLAHLGKPELMPLIFDDLAEVHHLAGVSDAELTAPPAAATPAQPA